MCNLKHPLVCLKFFVIRVYVCRFLCFFSLCGGITDFLFFKFSLAFCVLGGASAGTCTHAHTCAQTHSYTFIPEHSLFPKQFASLGHVSCFLARHQSLNSQIPRRDFNKGREGERGRKGHEEGQKVFCNSFCLQALRNKPVGFKLSL